MNNQLDLILDTATPADLRDDVAAMVRILCSRGEWMTAAEVLASLGRPPSESNKRYVRRLAEYSESWIISGQRGYRHIKSASADEIAHACNVLESMGQNILRRAVRTRRLHHQLAG